MIRHPRFVIFLVLLVGFSACKDGGCGGAQKADTIPATVEARVEQMVSKLPVQTDTAVIAPDLAKMRASLNVVKDRLPDTGIVQHFQQATQQMFGVDLLDEQSWKNAGIAPDSTAVVAVHRSRLILMMYVENRQAFEKTLVEKAKAAFSIEAVTKTETVGDHTMKILSDSPQLQIAWLYDGKMALVSMPALTGEGALEDGSAKLVLAEVAEAKGDASLYKQPGFQSFKSALLTDYALAGYGNPQSGLESDAAKKEMGDDATAAAVGAWAKENVTFLGAGLRADADKVELKAYVGLNPLIVKALEVAKKPSNAVNWDAFATDKLLLGARVSLNPKDAYSLALNAMGDEQKRTLRRNLKNTGDAWGLDLEADVIDRLAGHVGVFFYGLAGGNPMQLMTARGPEDVANMLGLMAVLKFQDQATVDHLLAKVLENRADRFTLRPFIHLPDDPNFKVLAPSNGAIGNFFIHGDTVVFATTAFGDEAMHKYLTNTRDDQKLSAMDLNLGKAFAQDDAFTGLYLSSARAMDNLKSILAIGGFGQILAAVEEASLRLDTDDGGGFAHLTIDLAPAPAKPADADAPAPTPAP